MDPRPPAKPLQPPPSRDWFGHPRGLSTLFFSEMWERFSYYGMRALLVLFLTTPEDLGGLGFSAATAGLIYGAYTSMVYLVGVPGGWVADKFLGLKRAVLLGGIGIMLGHIFLALPATSTFYVGLALIVLGTGLLKPCISTLVGQLYTTEDPRRDAGFSIYYMGINLGAFLAPLTCTYLAQSESFRHFLTSTGIGSRSSWHFGFGAAAVGMGLGLVQYLIGLRHLRDAGNVPPPAADPVVRTRNKQLLGAILAGVFGLPLVIGILAAADVVAVSKERVGVWVGWLLFTIVVGVFGALLRGPRFALAAVVGVWTAAGIWTATPAGPGHWVAALVFVAVVVAFAVARVKNTRFTDPEHRRLWVVMLLFFGASVFWSCFEQAGSTMTLFADRATRNQIFGWTFPSGYWQSVNSVFVIIMAPVFAWLWLRLAVKRRDPSSPTKFGIAMVLMAASFLWMAVPGGMMVADPAGKVGPHWLVVMYFVQTCAELCLSPVGLSSMTRLAPPSIGSMVMGLWFLGSAVGNYMAGYVASFYEKVSLQNIFLIVACVPAATAILFFVLVRPIRRMLGEQRA